MKTRDPSYQAKKTQSNKYTSAIEKPNRMDYKALRAPRKIDVALNRGSA